MRSIHVNPSTGLFSLSIGPKKTTVEAPDFITDEGNKIQLLFDLKGYMLSIIGKTPKTYQVTFENSTCTYIVHLLKEGSITLASSGCFELSGGIGLKTIVSPDKKSPTFERHITSGATSEADTSPRPAGAAFGGGGGSSGGGSGGASLGR